MKTFNHVILRTAVAIAFGSAVAAYAYEDQPVITQRAAANAREMQQVHGPRVTALPKAGPSMFISGNGKAWAQMQESKRQVTKSSGDIDLAHAPRPVTASKDPDFDQKLRENAQQFQVAPVK